ncbi:MAG: cupin domain-containing protein [Planctomycetota bacterium]|jgi:mannose-6-phosphate isomerase-like protein (cupin superfamily)
MQKVNIAEKLSQIHDQWNPRIAGELNGQHVRLVKIQGEFAYHKHDDEDEMFLVIQGALQLDFKEKKVDVREGEFIIVPKGVVHRPYAAEEVHLMMFVTASNVNTGDVRNERTLDTLERI